MGGHVVFVDRTQFPPAWNDSEWKPQDTFLSLMLQKLQKQFEMSAVRVAQKQWHCDIVKKDLNTH